MAISYSQAAVTITEIYRGNLALQDSSIAKKINAPLCFTPRGANVPWRRPPRRSTGAPHRCAVAAQLQGPTAAFRDETTPPCPPCVRSSAQLLARHRWAPRSARVYCCWRSAEECGDPVLGQGLMIVGRVSVLPAGTEGEGGGGGGCR
jgi:hypothetical protein